TFSTERKFMGTLGQAPGMQGAILHIKGAPEIVLARCVEQLTPSGKHPLTASDREFIEKQLKAYQQRGMRTLGLAYHDHLAASVDVAVNKSNESLETLAQGLTWLGFFVIHDLIRPELSAALAICARAGVQVKMV